MYNIEELCKNYIVKLNDVQYSTIFQNSETVVMSANIKKIEVINAIKDSAGIMSHVARKLNCDWHTAKKYVEKWEETKQALVDECEAILDLAENKTIEAINNGDMQTIRWFLATKGKQRGFSEKYEVEHSGGVKIIKDDI